MDKNKINIDTLINIQKNNNFQLTHAEYIAIQEELTHYEDSRSVSVEALKIIQKDRGWVSDEAIVLIANLLNISVTDLEGVATFYNHIFRQPVGRHIIRYCDSIVCELIGYKKIQEDLQCELKITVGNTTVDNRFTLLPTCCLGMCNKAPVVMINQDIYVNVVSESIIRLLGRYL